MKSEVTEMKEKKEYTMLPWSTKEKIFELWGTKPVDEILDELDIPLSKKRAVHSLVSRQRKFQDIKAATAFSSPESSSSEFSSPE
jgi:hypothetical protein